MPRPKSEITGKQHQIVIRVTKPMQQEFKRSFGPQWMRKLLAESIEKRLKNTDSTTGA